MKLSLVALCAALTSPMWGATYTVFFSNPDAATVGVSNSVSFAGGPTPLIGTSIDINTDVKKKVNPPGGAPTTVVGACPSCVLNFTTGAEVGFVPSGGGGTYVFGSGGSLTIKNGSTIVSGSFTTSVTVQDTGSGLDVVGGVILDTQSTAFNTFVFGANKVGSFPWTGTLSLALDATGGGGLAFQSVDLQAGTAVQNSSSAPIPEPTTGVLYSALAGALGFCLWRRRQSANDAR